MNFKQWWESFGKDLFSGFAIGIEITAMWIILSLIY